MIDNDQLNKCLFEWYQHWHIYSKYEADAQVFCDEVWVIDGDASDFEALWHPRLWGSNAD